MNEKVANTDELIGYIKKYCVYCGRQRVELYKSGMEVCEKCGVDQKTGEFVIDDYYKPI